MSAPAWLACGFAVLALALAAAESQRSVWDGVYTEKQAARGRVLYDQHCSECHGDDLEGDAEAPALAGGDFLWKWNGVALEHLFQRTYRDMPLYKAGSLSRQACVDILAYVLRVNQLPVGKSELPHDESILRQIRLEPARTSTAR